MKKRATKQTRPVVTDLPVVNDDDVKGGEYLEFKLKEVYISNVQTSK